MIFKLTRILIAYNFFITTSTFAMEIIQSHHYNKNPLYAMTTESPIKPKDINTAQNQKVLSKIPSVPVPPQQRLRQLSNTPTTAVKPYKVSMPNPNLLLFSEYNFHNNLLNNLDNTARNVASLNPAPQDMGSFCRRSFDQRSGYCLLAYQCLHVIREYRLHGVKIDICTYHNNLPVICCPLADKLILYEQRISAQKCKEYHEAVKDIKLNQPRPLSGKMCVGSLPLIVGGKITKKEEYPHMAALGWSEKNKETKWACGGTLISDQYVLTAAHCTTSGVKPPNIVRLGSLNLNRTTPEQQDIKILVIIVHPRYRSSTYYHDIALLKLVKPLQFSTYIQPACLWQLPDLEMSNAIATGWGRTEFMGPKSNELQKVHLNIINQDICKKIYYKETRLPHGINWGQFCAGNLEGGKDTCQGDSGGPLYAELPEFNCVKFIIGITSFGKVCAAPNSPGVYTKISAYLDWIEKIVFR